VPDACSAVTATRASGAFVASAEPSEAGLAVPENAKFVGLDLVRGEEVVWEPAAHNAQVPPAEVCIASCAPSHSSRILRLSASHFWMKSRQKRGMFMGTCQRLPKEHPEATQHREPFLLAHKCACSLACMHFLGQQFWANNGKGILVPLLKATLKCIVVTHCA
jgi:hypothetical protein